MVTADPRIDAYIKGAQPFARPILRQLRAIAHAACPDCTEAIKWRMPAFLYKGKIIATMASFKAHAVFGVWRGPEAGKAGNGAREAMGSLGRLTRIEDLPDEATLTAMLAGAMALIDAGGPRKPAATPKAEIPVPDDLAAALAARPEAFATFDAFSPSQRREYVEWIVEAKRPETRARRLGQAIAMLAEGKTRHWKYQNC